MPPPKAASVSPALASGFRHGGVGPPKVQQPLSVVVTRRVAPQSTSTLQRILRVWPALVLLIACIGGLVTTRWKPSSPSSANSSSSNATTKRIAHEAALNLFAQIDRTEEQRVQKQKAAFDSYFANKNVPPHLRDMDAPMPESMLPQGEEETDLSLFPPSAHNRSSLIEINSVLLPESWTVQTDLGDLAVKRILADPILLHLPRFLTPAECGTLIRDAQKAGFSRSTTVGGIDKTRTSESAPLPAETHPVIQRMVARASNITSVPRENFEVGPVIRYKIGQEFQEHWDSTKAGMPGRILTLFVPLSSVPGEDGGATFFPMLNQRFPPVNGSAILWRNYMPKSHLGEYDRRMKHAGEPPRKGLKYAINLWIYKKRYQPMGPTCAVDPM